MSNKRAWLYEQGKNECTLYSIMNIWRTKWGIILNKEQQDKLIQDAEDSWIWSEESWAIFDFIYNWVTWWVYKNTWIEMTVYATNIHTTNFEERLVKWDTFWLWLVTASSWYKESRKDQEITQEEVDNFDWDNNKRYWHNHTYKYGYIIETLSSVPDDEKLIKMKLSVLRSCWDKGVYRNTARTFDLQDQLLDYYLKQFNNGGKVVAVETLPDEHQKAIEKAMELRTMYLRA